MKCWLLVVYYEIGSRDLTLDLRRYCYQKIYFSNANSLTSHMYFVRNTAHCFMFRWISIFITSKCISMALAVNVAYLRVAQITAVTRKIHYKFGQVPGSCKKINIIKAYLIANLKWISKGCEKLRISDKNWVCEQMKKLCMCSRIWTCPPATSTACSPTTARSTTLQLHSFLLSPEKA